uniref:ATP synthase F0 subunit 8 n=1 Tax=Sinolapotamon patellifer TaxID=2715824 RepID=A0A6G7L2J8_9EUCA|nr:ATP synthase F0 subunit 8 [Sinolapotamon patellifer]QII91827.1 ATP synthase F0 subunit 8 [Sinolapotamon patellifer]
MPQMSPLFWLILFPFFLISLLLFLMINYFIKPFKMFPFSSLSYSISPYFWKL